MNRYEKYDLAEKKHKQGVKTYLSKFNRYGNRECLTVNHPKRIFMSSGSNHGEYGEVYDDCSVREIQEIKKDLLATDYTHVRHNISQNFSYFTSINTDKICSCCYEMITDNNDENTVLEECAICHRECCSDCLTLEYNEYICPNCFKET